MQAFSSPAISSHADDVTQGSKGSIEHEMNEESQTNQDFGESEVEDSLIVLPNDED